MSQPEASHSEKNNAPDGESKSSASGARAEDCIKSTAATDETSQEIEKDTTTLYLFDVDGTLVSQREGLSRDMNELLTRASKKVCVGVVSGGDMRILAEQMNGLERSIDCVCAENGTHYFKKGIEVFSTDVGEFIGSAKMTDLMNFVMSYISKLDLPTKKGNFVETKRHMIHVSPVGRAAGEKDRQEFKRVDKEKNIRLNFIKALKARFPAGFAYNMAGEIGFDVYPIGWDKSFCLNNLEKEKFKTIHFFGDKVDKEGNDYEIFHDQRVIGHRVTGPADTKRQVSELLSL